MTEKRTRRPRKTQDETPEVTEETPPEATPEATVAAPEPGRKEPVWKLATENQRASFFSGKRDPGRRYKIVQQGRASVLMTTKG